VTGGLDWNDALAPLMAVSMWLAIALLLYVAFVVVALLNIVTGVFVQAALATSEAETDSIMTRNICDLLQTHKRVNGLSDSGNNLTFADFKGYLDCPQMSEYFRAINVDPSEAESVFNLLDNDQSGAIDTDEFLHGCIRLRGPARALELALLSREVREIGRRLEVGGHLDLDSEDEDAVADADVMQVSPTPTAVSRKPAKLDDGAWEVSVLQANLTGCLRSDTADQNHVPAW